MPEIKGGPKAFLSIDSTLVSNRGVIRIYIYIYIWDWQANSLSSMPKLFALLSQDFHKAIDYMIIYVIDAFPIIFLIV